VNSEDYDGSLGEETRRIRKGRRSRGGEKEKDNMGRRDERKYDWKGRN
jgi:hypothetical protein